MVRYRSTHARALFAGASLAVLGIAAAAPAVAQEKGNAEVEELVVTGFRSSLQEALVLKRESAIAADSILAEDIGKFPTWNSPSRFSGSPSPSPATGALAVRSRCVAWGRSSPGSASTAWKP